MEHRIRIDAETELWAEERGDPTASPLLLVMGANASGVAWPEALVDRLARQHRVIRYDHRDTGRSTWAFDSRPYAIRDLAEDAVAVLDALGAERAHVVGMSMGGVLVQLLLLDHPDRLLTATVFATAALGVGLAGPGGGPAELPGPDPDLLEYWGSMGEERDAEAELAWRVEHWRRLNGAALPFDPAEFRALEEAVVAHTGHARAPVAHALADQSGLERGPELAGNRVPTLVVEAPEDPINPPPHAANLAATIGSARLVTIPGMGHALPARVLGPLADAILQHTAAADG
ncbi:UNVERIFIED_ORG: alpha/beta fold hydrolase [Bacillus sp. AZ43]